MLKISNKRLTAICLSAIFIIGSPICVNAANNNSKISFGQKIKRSFNVVRKFVKDNPKETAAISFASGAGILSLIFLGVVLGSRDAEIVDGKCVKEPNCKQNSKPKLTLSPKQAIESEVTVSPHPKGCLKSKFPSNLETMPIPGVTAEQDMYYGFADLFVNSLQNGAVFGVEAGSHPNEVSQSSEDVAVNPEPLVVNEVLQPSVPVVNLDDFVDFPMSRSPSPSGSPIEINPDLEEITLSEGLKLQIEKYCREKGFNSKPVGDLILFLASIKNDYYDKRNISSLVEANCTRLQQRANGYNRRLGKRNVGDALVRKFLELAINAVPRARWSEWKAFKEKFLRGVVLNGEKLIFDCSMLVPRLRQVPMNNK